MKTNKLHSVSKKILKNIAIEKMIGTKVHKFSRDDEKSATLVRWISDKETAKREHIDILNIDIGFISEVNNLKGIVSICLDSKGMHHLKESDIHECIAHKRTNKELKRALAAIKYKNDNYISQYNEFGVNDFNEAPRHPRNNIIIIDEEIKCPSVIASGCGQSDFEKMIYSAHKNYPDSKIIIYKKQKQKKGSSFATNMSKNTLKLVSENKRIHITDAPINPIQLIKQSNTVYTISSTLGFEACLLNKEVHVYGKPFYYGYGLTIDYRDSSKEIKSKEEVFYGAYIDYCRYINPISNVLCQIEDVLELAATNIPINPKSQIIIKSNNKNLNTNLKKLMYKFSIKIPSFNRNFYNTIVGHKEHKAGDCTYIEESFIRSKTEESISDKPIALTIDSKGRYGDHQSESDLIEMLNNHTCTEREISRAKAITEISKSIKNNETYNEEYLNYEDYILIIGQDESDVNDKNSRNNYTNEDTIRVGKERFPNKKVIYLKGRSNYTPKTCEASDLITIKETINNEQLKHLISKCICVFTITSKLAIQALVMGKHVYCLGYPFYYGWGLTESEINLPKRVRNLSLVEFIGIYIIRHTTYYNYDMELYVRAEEAIHNLE